MLLVKFDCYFENKKYHVKFLFGYHKSLQTDFTSYGSY